MAKRKKVLKKNGKPVAPRNGPRTHEEFAEEIKAIELLAGAYRSMGIEWQESGVGNIRVDGLQKHARGLKELKLYLRAVRAGVESVKADAGC